MRGYEDVARNYVNTIFGGQDPDSRIPPIQGEDAPWSNNEWDAQGEAIYLAMQVYHYSGDETFLEAVYPHIAGAADYILALRNQTADDPPSTRGLLPISLSAEDLADGEQHYYWDNFWALVGLTQAAEAATILNAADDAARWQAEASALVSNRNQSVRSDGRSCSYVPASVEHRTTPGWLAEPHQPCIPSPDIPRRSTHGTRF
ncbi:MAG: hypothetical protein R3C44_12855 [Chloroflexota bacterium]